MPKVVCLGLHIVDILGRPVTQVPDGQNVALLEEIRVTVAGTAAGTAVDLAKMGADVYAIGAIGDDALGHFLVDTMHRYGIHTEGLRRKPGVQTSATMLPIRPNGERPALHVKGANATLEFDDIALDIVAAADYLHMGGASLLPALDGEPMARVLRYARENGVVTTFDQVAVPRPDLLDIITVCMPYVDFFMPGLEEATMMCGREERQAAMRFFLEAGARHVVFKMGSRGSSVGWLEEGQMRDFTVPVLEVPVVDSTGCGDAYCAGFIMGLSMGWDLERCARLGTAAGGLVIQGLGSDAGIMDLQSTIDRMGPAA